MSEKHTFRVVIERGQGVGAFVSIPFDVDVQFPAAKRPAYTKSP